jgi:hypothetical protein
VQGSDLVLFCLLGDLIHNGFDLTLALPAADDEVIGQQRNGTYVQQHDVGAFFIGDGIDYLPGQFYGLQLISSSLV